MNNSAIISCMMSTSVGVAATATPNTSSSQSAGEPKRAFADTPPMVKARNELKSCKTDTSERVSDSDVQSERAVACEQQRGESPVRQKEQKTEVQDRPEEVSAETTDDSVEAATEATSAGQDETSMTTPAQEPAADPAETVSEPALAEMVATSTDETAAVAGAAEPSAETTVVSEDAIPPKGEVAEPIVKNRVATASAGEPLAAPGETTPNPLGDKGEAVAVSAGQVNTPVSGPARTDEVPSGAGAENAGVVSSGQNGLASSDTATIVQEKADSAAPVVTEAASAVQMVAGQQTSGETTERGVRQEGTASPQIEVQTAGTSDGEQVSSDEVSKVSSDAQVEVAVVEGQTKAGPSAHTSEATKAGSEVPIETHDTQTSVSESTSSARSIDAANTEGLVGRSPVQNVGDQILESVHASLTRGDKQIEVRLDPPELGSVTVRFQEQDGQITGVLEVSKDQTRQEIEQALPQVLRGMQESGILIRRLDVVIADQPEGDLDLDRETPFQDAWAQQGESDQQNAQAGSSPGSRWARWATEQEGLLEQSGASSIGVAAQDRINILL